MTAETQLKVARSLTIAGILIGTLATATDLFDKWSIWIVLASSICTGLGTVAKRWAGHFLYTILGGGFTVCGLAAPVLTSAHPKVSKGIMLAGMLILVFGKTAFNFDASATTNEPKSED